MYWIKGLQNPTIVFGKVVYADASKRTKPYKQGRTHNNPNFTCSIPLYTEQDYKKCNRDHHDMLCTSEKYVLSVIDYATWIKLKQ